MSKLKDKLSANMRTVKANQPQAAAKPASTQPAPANKPHPQAGAKPAPAAKPSRPSTKKVAGDVPDSGATLFPDRVWPD